MSLSSKEHWRHQNSSGQTQQRPLLKVSDVPETRPIVVGTSGISFVKVSDIFGIGSDLDLIMELG
jgi:hypothetical protein